MKKITLFLNDLFEGDKTEKYLSCPSFIKLIKTAKVIEKTTSPSVLFNIPEPFPMAALCALSDFGEIDEGWWICADPVHLMTMMTHVTLGESPVSSLSEQESSSLVATLNEFLLEEGLKVVFSHPQRWYIHCPNDPDLGVVASQKILGKNLFDYLPKRKSEWLRRFNEVQMLFFEHSVNLQRQQAGLAEVNSVWFWGDAKKPDGLDLPFDSLWGNEVYLQGLGKLASCPVEKFTNLAELLTGDELNHAIVLAGHSEDVFDVLCDELKESLKEQKISELNLMINDKEYCVTNISVLPFWRRIFIS
jgi:hypothetical protein